MASEAVWIAAFGTMAAIAASVIAPILLLVLQNRGKVQEKEADAKAALKLREQEWARQDVVAAKAEEAARLLAAKQEEIAEQAREAARLLVENNAHASNLAEVTHFKLDRNANAVANVTTLVDGALTREKYNTLHALKAQLAALMIVRGLNKRLPAGSDDASGITPEEELATVDMLKESIAELEKELREREQSEAAIKTHTNAPEKK